MRFYRQQHQFYCGVDLHAKRIYVCLINREGEILIHKNIQTRADHFLTLLRAYLGQDLIVGVECMFKWYWLADLCREHNIRFVLGHAPAERLLSAPEEQEEVVARLSENGLCSSQIFLYRDGPSGLEDSTKNTHHKA